MIGYVIMSVAVALFTGFAAKIPIPMRPLEPDGTGASDEHRAVAQDMNLKAPKQLPAELVNALARVGAMDRRLAERRLDDLMRRAAGYRKLAETARTQGTTDGFLALAQRYDELAERQRTVRQLSQLWPPLWLQRGDAEPEQT